MLGITPGVKVYLARQPADEAGTRGPSLIRPQPRVNGLIGKMDSLGISIDLVSRPADLPDFSNPPLTEVVISVQFDALPNYRQVWAGAIWDLFKANFPIVQEQLPLLPAFETFGSTVPPSMNFSILDVPIPSRLWFLNKDETELLQFQGDRFGRNWRKLPPLDNSYPRFESMIADFSSDLESLAGFCRRNEIGSLEPNQCELTYVNFVPARALEQMQLNAVAVLKVMQFGPGAAPAAFNTSCGFVLQGEEGVPFGRLHLQTGTVTRVDGVEGLNITLTARGSPRERNVQSSVERLIEFRERIVRTFDSVTSESAHRAWGRK